MHASSGAGTYSLYAKRVRMNLDSSHKFIKLARFDLRYDIEKNSNTSLHIYTLNTTGYILQNTGFITLKFVSVKMKTWKKMISVTSSLSLWYPSGVTSAARKNCMATGLASIRQPRHMLMSLWVLKKYACLEVSILATVIATPKWVW